MLTDHSWRNSVSDAVMLLMLVMVMLVMVMFVNN